MIFFIHGIGYSAADTVDRMANKMDADGHKTCPLYYPKTSWYNARNRGSQYRNAEYLLNTIESWPLVEGEPRCVVAHSNGCLISARILEIMGNKWEFGAMVFFAPALDANWIFPRDRFKSLHVVHNPRDRAIWFARLAPFQHPWGEMGRVGYKGVDARVKNVLDLDKTGARFQHSHYFDEPRLTEWTRRVETWIGR